MADLKRRKNKSLFGIFRVGKNRNFSKYYLKFYFRDSGLNWARADARAIEKNGFLAEIKNKERNSEIAEIVARCKENLNKGGKSFSQIIIIFTFAGYPAGSRVWFGGNNLANFKIWRWSKGQRQG